MSIWETIYNYSSSPAMETVDENCDKESPASCILIEDVLSKIFEFLPSEDRNNARLVCKQWLQLLNQKCFTKKDAFFFPRFYGNRKVIKRIKQCQRYDLITLKFELRQFVKGYEMFWQKCGKKIESLHFSKCLIYPDMFRHVFTYCVNLKHLHVEKCDTSNSLTRPYTIHDLLLMVINPYQRDYVRLIFPIENQVLVHKNLTFLDLYEGPQLNASDLSSMTSAFPKLETLKIVLDCSSNAETNTFSNSVELLQTRFNHLISLHVKFQFKDDIGIPKDFSSLSRSNFTRLKNVSFAVNASGLTEENIKRFFSYECWSSISIFSCSWPEIESNLIDSFNLCVVCMLENHLFLEELYTNCFFADVLEFCAIFTALVKSSLKHLDLHVKYFGDVSRNELIFQQAEKFLPKAKNYTLLRLRIDTDTHIQELSHLFLKYFPNIRDLELPTMDDMDIIFQQKNLKSLTICLSDDSLRWVSPKLSMESLEFLEFDLSVVPHIEELLNLQVPNLRYLIFVDNPEARRAYRKKNSRKMFLALPELFSQKFPNLRGIEIRWRNQYGLPNLEDLQVYFKSFQNFHHLRYISLTIPSANRELEAYWKHFTSTYLEHCSSLKTLCIMNGRITHYYYYDVFAKTFQSIKQFIELSSAVCDDRMNFKSYWLNNR